jgi:hypothetical protein
MQKAAERRSRGFRLLQILWRRLASFATGAAVIFRMAACGSSPIGAEVG